MGLLGAVLLLASVPPVAAQPTAEYQIKAVFLYHFAQFVEWPRTAFASAQAPLVIGVLGDDPFGDYLDETVRGEFVNHRPLVVERYRHVADIRACHILFVSDSERERLPQLLPGLSEQGILTVGNDRQFTEAGGVIQFSTEQNKIRMRINVEAARAGRLQISAKLLRLAETDRG